MSRPNSNQQQRVIFSIDVDTLNTIREIQADGGYKDLAETVQDSLIILRAIQTQAKEGFTDVVTRNTDAGDERIITINDGNKR